MKPKRIGIGQSRIRTPATSAIRLSQTAMVGSVLLSSQVQICSIFSTRWRPENLSAHPVQLCFVWNAEIKKVKVLERVVRTAPIVVSGYFRALQPETALGPVRLCGIFERFAKSGFGFFLLQCRAHTHDPLQGFTQTIGRC